MNYREKIESANIIKQTCFEHVYRFEKHESFVKRLCTERGLFESNLSGISTNFPVVSLIIIVDREPDRDLERTINSWGLQSCPFVQCQLIPSGEFDHRVLEEWVAGRAMNNGVDLDVISNGDIWKSCDSEYVIFAKSGDVLHPSLVTTLILSLASKHPDIIAFNYQYISNDAEDPIRFCRLPLFDQFALLHSNYIGTSFAVKTEVIKQYPYNIIDHIQYNDGHLFHIWCSINKEIKWTAHPEYFFLRPIKNIPASLLNIYTPYKNMYQKMFKALVNEFEFQEQGHNEQPYRLEPKRKARSISVIIPFRDKAEITCKCLDSILKQELEGSIEVILINNNSSDEATKILLEYIDKHEKHGDKKQQIKIINYQYPFNHSRQCNLGVETSSGEVIVFINNDAILKNLDVLESLCCWSVVTGIGTVGGRVVSPKGKVVSAGLSARLNTGFDYNSSIEESTDSAFLLSIKEVLGNTFACAAISRAVYDKVGLLNEIEFPNGYNDIEYNLRVKRAGYRNIYLGHLFIEHEPGTSRGRCDEIFQKILIRDRFPELANLSLHQLGSDEHLIQRWKKLTINSPVERVSNKVIHEWLRGLRNLVFGMLSRK